MRRVLLDVVAGIIMAGIVASITLGGVAILAAVWVVW